SALRTTSGPNNTLVSGTVLYGAVLYRTISCPAVRYGVVPSEPMSCPSVRYGSVPSQTMPCPAVLHGAEPSETVSRLALPQMTMPYLLGCGVVRRYGRISVKPFGNFCFNTSGSFNDGTMITSWPSSQLTGVAT